MTAALLNPLVGAVHITTQMLSHQCMKTKANILIQTYVTFYFLYPFALCTCFPLSDSSNTFLLSVSQWKHNIFVCLLSLLLQNHWNRQTASTTWYADHNANGISMQQHNKRMVERTYTQCTTWLRRRAKEVHWSKMEQLRGRILYVCFEYGGSNTKYIQYSVEKYQDALKSDCCIHASWHFVCVVFYNPQLRGRYITWTKLLMVQPENSSWHNFDWFHTRVKEAAIYSTIKNKNKGCFKDGYTFLLTLYHKMAQ